MIESTGATILIQDPAAVRLLEEYKPQSLTPPSPIVFALPDANLLTESTTVASLQRHLDVVDRRSFAELLYDRFFGLLRKLSYLKPYEVVPFEIDPIKQFTERGIFMEFPRVFILPSEPGSYTEVMFYGAKELAKKPVGSNEWEDIKDGEQVSLSLERHVISPTQLPFDLSKQGSELFVHYSFQRNRVIRESRISHEQKRISIGNPGEEETTALLEIAKWLERIRTFPVLPMVWEIEGLYYLTFWPETFLRPENAQLVRRFREIGDESLLAAALHNR